eukprot:jgi/Tetstr1/460628/TSEL_005826.t1
MASPTHLQGSLDVDPGIAELLRNLTAASGLPARVVVGDALRLWAETRGLKRGETVDAGGERPLCLRLPQANDWDAGAPPAVKQTGDVGTESDWGLAAEWLPKVFGALGDEAESLAAARLVCRDWAVGVMSGVRRLTLREVGAYWSDELEGGMEGVLSRCRELRDLGLCFGYGASENVKTATRLLHEVCRLPQLDSLHLVCSEFLPDHLDALRPLLPLLRTFSLRTGCETQRGEILRVKALIASLAEVTDLSLQITRRQSTPRTDVAELLAFPKCPTRLTLAGVDFAGASLLRQLHCLPALTELSLRDCLILPNTMGLDIATRLTSLVLQHGTETGERDRDDILGLTRLQRLRIDDFFESEAHYVRRLAGRLTSLTSLALPHWTPSDTEALQPLSALTGLAELEVGVQSVHGAYMAPGMRYLGSLTQLRQLALFFDTRDTAVTEQVVPHLASLTQLHTLEIRNGVMDGRTAQSLPAQLQHLGLVHCFVESDTLFDNVDVVRHVGDVLVAVSMTCSSLTSIDLPRNDGLSMCGLASLVGNCPQLAHIHVDCEALAYDDYSQLAGIVDVLLKMKPNRSRETHPESWHQRGHVGGCKWDAIRDIMHRVAG